MKNDSFEKCQQNIYLQSPDLLTCYGFPRTDLLLTHSILQLYIQTIFGVKYRKVEPLI